MALHQHAAPIRLIVEDNLDRFNDSSMINTRRRLFDFPSNSKATPRWISPQNRIVIKVNVTNFIKQKGVKRNPALFANGF